jgi:hypothetical protein
MLCSIVWPGTVREAPHQPGFGGSKDIPDPADNLNAADFQPHHRAKVQITTAELDCRPSQPGALIPHFTWTTTTRTTKTTTAHATCLRFAYQAHDERLLRRLRHITAARAEPATASKLPHFFSARSPLSPVMDEFASESDSDYTSYWRDWVSEPYSPLPHEPGELSSLLDPPLTTNHNDPVHILAG